MPASPLTDEIGRIVGGRYRIVAVIGAGPAARVFLADDVRLRRRVAVKLLPEALVEEASFVERFRTEMQAAAGLRHPHILVVHDWGTTGGLHLVTEYLEGGSVRAMIDRGVRLTPSQALQVGLAATRALEFAHARGVVHRDIRPANLLYTDDGRLRIGDFGLARAFADAAWTEPLGSGGTAARYSSPEQAQGRSVDGKADVYSLALVLIEAVTGTIPFQADTALGTLMARVGNPLSVPEELGPLVEPLARAGTDDPEARLDAAGFGVALMAVADMLPPPAPLSLTPPSPEPLEEEPHEGDTIVVTGPELDDLRHAAVVPTVEVATRVDRPAQADESLVAVATATVDPEPMAEAVASTVSAAASEDAPVGHTPDPRDDERRLRNRRRWTVAWISLLVVALVGGGAVGFLIWRARQTPTHPIPTMSGKSVTVATTQLRALGFVPVVRHERRDGSTKGDVLGTRPPAGAHVAEGRTVTLLVSSGQTLVTVPGNLTGLTEATAKSSLVKIGLTVGEPQQAWSETAPAGEVLGLATGTPKRIERGSVVTLVVSRGPEPRVIPDSTDLTPDQATAALTQLGLVPHTIERYDTKVDKGGLIGLEPGPGTSVPRGTDVNVVVSKGLLVAVPSLDGVNTVPGAILKLTSAGLVPDRVEGTGRLWGRPVAFDPPAGQLVVKGSAVDIIVE